MARVSLTQRPKPKWAGGGLMRRKWKPFSDLKVGDYCFDNAFPQPGEHLYKKVSPLRRDNLTTGGVGKVAKGDYVYVEQPYASAEEDREWLLQRFSDWEASAKLALMQNDKAFTSSEAALMFFAKQERGDGFVQSLVYGNIVAVLKPLLEDGREPHEQVSEVRTIVLETLAHRAMLGLVVPYDSSESPAERLAYLKAYGKLAQWLLSPFKDKS